MYIYIYTYISTIYINYIYIYQLYIYIYQLYIYKLCIYQLHILNIYIYQLYIYIHHQSYQRMTPSFTVLVLFRGCEHQSWSCLASLGPWPRRKRWTRRTWRTWTWTCRRTWPCDEEAEVNWPEVGRCWDGGQQISLLSTEMLGFERRSWMPAEPQQITPKPGAIICLTHPP